MEGVGTYEEAPRYRWEFVVHLTGWGTTAKEAWEHMQESLGQDGLGDPPDEVDHDDDDAYRHALIGGKDITVKGELEDPGPEGTLLVWEEEPKRSRP